METLQSIVAAKKYPLYLDIRVLNNINTIRKSISTSTSLLEGDRYGYQKLILGANATQVLTGSTTGLSLTADDTLNVAFDNEDLFTVDRLLVCDRAFSQLTLTNPHNYSLSVSLDYVTLNAPLVADFLTSTATGGVPLAVAFTDTSIGTPTSWLWDFGDGTTSVLESPTHTYTSAGLYDVTLTVTNIYGVNSKTRTALVHTETLPIASFTVDVSAGTLPLTVNFTDTSTGTINEWLWNFGDGSTSAEQSPSHVYYAADTYTASLTTINVAGSVTSISTIAVSVPTFAATSRLTANLPLAAWTSIAEGNNVFVAVSATSNVAATSRDGAIWTQQAITNLGLSKVVFANNKFVALPSSRVNSIFSSTDGVNWTQHVLPLAANWTSVAYGNGMYAIANKGDSLITSPDLITWTLHNMPAANGWKIAFQNSLFVAKDMLTAVCAVSADTFNWVSHATPSGNAWSSIVGVNGVFVLTGSATDLVATSTDGVAWTTSQLPSMGTWLTPVFDNNIFLTLKASSNEAAFSSDGINWTAIVLPINSIWTDLAYGKGKFLGISVLNPVVEIF